MSIVSNIAVSALSGAAAAGVVVLAGSVSLQGSTPGIADVGHSNISGYSLAGRFGANVSPTLARVQVNETGSLQGVRSVTDDGVSIFGKSTATTGLGAGGYFTTSSVGGRGIVGDALSGTGNTVGGLFYNRSSGGGVGVWGRAIGGGTATGVFGETTSSTGTALAGTNTGSGNSMVAGTSSDSLQTTGALPRMVYPGGGTAAMVPIAYGSVSGSASIFDVGSGNWSATNDGTGKCLIDVTGVTLNWADSTIIAIPYESDGSEFASVYSGTDFGINVFDFTSGALVNSDFYFVVYRKVGFSGAPLAPDLQESSKESKYGSFEAWRKKEPASFEAWRTKYVAWQRAQLASNPFQPPIDQAPRP